MKRILLLAMSLILLCSFPVRAAAGETGIYENAGALYEAWVSGNCVPDYITAVISTDGGTDNLTFGLVEGNAGEQGRQEILDLVRDDASITIMYQTYSRNELDRILDSNNNAIDSTAAKFSSFLLSLEFFKISVPPIIETAEIIISITTITHLVLQ